MNDLAEHISFDIDRANKAMRRYAQRVISDSGHDITLDQYTVLDLLAENDELIQSDLAEILYKDRASVSRITDSLVSKKFLKKKQANDKRAHRLVATKKGLQVHQALQKKMNEVMDSGLERVSMTELSLATTVLQKIIETYEKEL